MPKRVIPDPAKVCGSGPGSLSECGNQAAAVQWTYCSLRISASTTAVNKDFEDCLINNLWRWKNVAYLQYVKIPRQQLAGYCKQLVS